MLYNNHIFQCMSKVFCVKFQRVPLKFHTKYLTHTMKMQNLFKGENLGAIRFKSSLVFLKRPPDNIMGRRQWQWNDIEN